jgi:hypothetical protein
LGIVGLGARVVGAQIAKWLLVVSAIEFHEHGKCSDVSLSKWWRQKLDRIGTILAVVYSNIQLVYGSGERGQRFMRGSRADPWQSVAATRHAETRLYTLA